MSSGDTPLHLAAAEGHLNVLKHLLSSVVGELQKHVPVEDNFKVSIDYLALLQVIRYTFNINRISLDAVSALSAVNNDGMTPLELAKQYQKLETIDYLSNIQVALPVHT